MRKLLTELNNFSEGTTLHGFAYLSKGQTLCTRLIWSLILVGAAGVAGYFLYQTIRGFDENFTSTKIETRSVKEFPFPAVTFHPGEFNSNKGFLKMFLDQLEFTRYDKNDPLQNNDKFKKSFAWLYYPMNNRLFENIEETLKKEKKFINNKARIFENEVCNLVSLEDKRISIKKEIHYLFSENMYKYRGFSNAMKFNFEGQRRVSLKFRI